MYDGKNKRAVPVLGRTVRCCLLWFESLLFDVVLLPLLRFDFFPLFVSLLPPPAAAVVVGGVKSRNTVPPPRSSSKSFKYTNKVARRCPPFDNCDVLGISS